MQYWKKTILTLVVLLLGLSILSAQALIGTILTGVNVRAGSSQDFAKVGTLDARTAVNVEGRNRFGNWVLVSTESVRGWVASRYLTWDETITLESLPVLDEVIGTPVTSPAPSADAPAAEVPTTGGVVGSSITTLNVRTGSATTQTALTQLVPGTTFTLEARNDAGDWLLINTGSLRGWVATRFVKTDADTSALPASLEVVGQTSAPAGVVSAPDGSIPLTEGDANIVALLERVPVVSGVGANAVAIYQRGVAQGRNPNYFLKVGDSNTASRAFLGGFGTGNYVLGSFASLQPTIDFFQLQGNSWWELSQVAQSGNLTTTVIDPIFTSGVNCGGGETPLACDIRIKNPSIALIYLGAADNQSLDAATYAAALRQIVQTCINENVLPILTTMPTRPHPVRPQSYGLSFDAIIVQVAREYDIPLLNMWQATRALPDNGMQGDLLHFTITPNYGIINFNGDQNIIGYTAWNLGALQMLDAIRVAVGG